MFTDNVFTPYREICL